MGIREKAISSLRRAWGAHAAQQAISFGSMVILSRQLRPEDFGLMAMAWIFAGFTTVVADAGTIGVLVSHPVANQADLDELFWGSVAWGTCLAVFLVVAAPLAERLFNEVRVAPMLRVLSVGVFFTSMSSVPRALAQRELRFTHLGVAETAAPLAGAAIAWGMAHNGHGAWSLVAQSVSSSALSAVMLWLKSEFRPGRFTSPRRLYGPGQDGFNISAFTLVNYAGRNVDNLIIGAFLGPRELALYAIAYRLMYVPIGSVAAVFSRVLTPVYTMIRTDDERQARAYLEGIENVALLTFPMMTGLACLAAPFVKAVFGPQWGEAALPIAILAPAGILQSLTHSAWGIYQSRHRTTLMLRAALISLALTGGAFWAARPFGIAGMAVAYVLASVVSTGPQLLPALKILGVSLSDFTAALRPAAVSSAAMFIVLMALNGSDPEAQTLHTMAMYGVLGIAVYLSFLRSLYPAFFERLNALLARGVHLPS